MELNFSKKLTGWELTDLIDILKNDKSKLVDYSKSYTLSAINTAEDRFVVIRKFASREFEGKIDMLNCSDIEGSEYYPRPQFGMTLVSVSNAGASIHNVILPNSLKYESVELNEETISINHSLGLSITNFKEINRLWTLENLKEDEILKQFNSLTNLIEEPQKIEKYAASSIENDFFGQLRLNEELGWYEVTKDGIEFYFTNKTLERLNQTLRKTEKLLSLLDKIENRMVQEMVPLKNKSWLEDREIELSKEKFQKEIKIYSINTYEDGSAALYYKANDLFWGHEIQISIDNDLNYQGSTLIG